VRQLKQVSHRLSVPAGNLLPQSIDWAQLRQIFDSIPVRVALLDREHRVLYVNTEWCKSYGMAEDTVLGRTIAEVHNEEMFADVRPWAARALAGQAGEWDGWVELPWGKRFVGRTFAPLQDAAGAVEGYFIFSHDLTDLRQTEQAKNEAEAALAQLKQAQESLVRAEKLASLGQLVAGIAHEINTPVGNALAASSQMGDETARLETLIATGKLRRSELEDYLGTVRELSDILMRNCQRAGQLIRDFKQVAADQTSGQRRRFDLADQLRETLRTLHHRFDRAKVSLMTDLPANILMDSLPGALSQIIINLAENVLVHAVAPGTAGSLTVSAKPIARDRVEITVADDGKGITSEVLPKIFDPFFTTNRDAGNTGLGLHIVHNLVTGPLGGIIQVTSALGEGTQFVLRLPLASPAPATPVSHDEIAPLLNLLSR
jgi:two-component system, NtrC family, sensor kinase